MHSTVNCNFGVYLLSLELNSCTQCCIFYDLSLYSSYIFWSVFISSTTYCLIIRKPVISISSIYKHTKLYTCLLQCVTLYGLF